MSRQIRDRHEYETGAKWFADWHREHPDNYATMVDVDGVGYCHRCLRPLYIIEATRSRRRKTAAVAERLADMLACECIVLYRDDTRPTEILVDRRTAGELVGWVPDGQAWDIFQEIRSRHDCDA